MAQALPKGPSRTKNTTGSKFSTETKFATTIAKRYGECSELLVFFQEKEAGKRYRKLSTTAVAKCYGFKRRSILVRKGPLDTKPEKKET